MDSEYDAEIEYLRSLAAAKVSFRSIVAKTPYALDFWLLLCA